MYHLAQEKIISGTRLLKNKSVHYDRSNS